VVHVAGDIFEGGLDEDRFIVFCTDDTARWGKKGLFGVIAKKWPDVQKNYEQQKPKLGSCLITKVESEPHKVQVVCIVVQKAATMTGVSPLNYKALQEALNELGTIAKLKGCSVHMAHPSPAIPNLEMEKVEKLLKKHLTAKGVSTYIYSLSPPPSPQEKKDKKEKNKVDAGNGHKDQKTEVTKDLPTVFSGMTVCFHSSTPDLEQVKRYLIAYGGDVDDMGTDLTHIVAANDSDVHQDMEEEIKGNSNVKVVSPQWVWDSINTKSHLSEDSYIIQS